jgi:peptide/nickel transport system substrate-binding protein
MRVTLNNTVVFGGQALRRPSAAGRGAPARAARGSTTTSRSGGARRPGLALAILVAGLGFSTLGTAGCRKQKKPSPASQRSGSATELNPARPPPPPAATLPPPDAVPAPTRHGGSVRVHLAAEPANLLPLADADASTSQVTNGLIYQTLLDCNSGSYQPGLAESWDVSDDRMRIAVRVRSGVRWHDRRAFGVLDVQATLEPLLRAGAEATVLRAELADVAAVELVTERTVRLVLKRPSDLVLRALCDVPMLPDHLVRGIRIESSSLMRQPVGTGPFRFAGWERGKRIRLERVPDWWGPPVGVDEIVFDLDSDAVRALNRTRRGEMDILTRVLDVHYPDQVDPTTLHGTSALYRLSSHRYSFLVLNHAHQPLGDVQFRRALSGLWDRARFASELHADLVRPIGGPPLVGDPAAPPFDRPRAIAALEAAGYRDSDADGVRDQGGKPFRLTMLEPSGNKLFNVEARAFVLEARKSGLLIDLIPTDPAVIMQRLKKGDFDIVPMTWQGAPDEDPLPLWAPGAPFNFTGYRSDRLDALLDGVRLADGPAARRPVLERLQALLADEQPVIFLYRYDVPALVGARVRGLAAVGDRFDLRRVWLE